ATTHGTSFTYQARVIDAAANVGNTGSQAVTIDTTAPTAAVDITAIADDTGTTGDFVTSDTSLTVSGTNGALGAGEKVQVSSNGGATRTDVVQDTRTTWHLVDPTTHRTSFTHHPPAIHAPPHIGNTHLPPDTTDTTRPARTILTTPPTAAVDLRAIPAVPARRCADLTSDTSLTVSGTNGALGAGEKVQVSSNGGATWTDVVQDTGTTWHLVDPTTHGADFTYQARGIDAPANVGNTDSQAVPITPQKRPGGGERSARRREDRHAAE